MDAKLCTRCGKVKPVDDFHRWRRDGRQPWCKECRKVYDAACHRRTWGPARLEQKRAWQREFSTWFRTLKLDRPCADCGGSIRSRRPAVGPRAGDNQARESERSRSRCESRPRARGDREVRARLRELPRTAYSEPPRGVAQPGRAPRLGRGGFAGSNPAAPIGRHDTAGSRGAKPCELVRNGAQLCERAYRRHTAPPLHGPAQNQEPRYPGAEAGSEAVDSMRASSWL